MGLGDDAVVAAKWWADQLRSIPKFDNGDKSGAGGMTAMFARMAAINTSSATDEQISLFQSALEEVINKQLAAGLSQIIGVDYHPDMTLCDACEAAGIDSNNRFPVKTVMWVYPGLVHLSHGYGAKAQELYCDGRGLEKLKTEAENNLKILERQETQ